ncbi:helix-turn-helix domain-containing protein [Acuticoccus mangrovi]|uniref:AraC family transcriptional regulator ligand-binding domain-containing protein n=1 Tax=Acuticoccus mangrovi TaxID=2796142 RepID=A0A934MD49_9HYPH|nr:AraC family transcriptional regulator [Acuticoccus mangrovi]MBJ3775962.1 AraC family transcriptional regulator ligand-binding domain-containing protein [Acuticoccus mangrovi]
MGPLPAMLEERAGHRMLERIFRSEGVPLGVIDEPHTPVPISAIQGIFARTGQLLEDRTFGLQVGERMRSTGFGMWVEYALAADDLRSGLIRLTKTSWNQQTVGHMELADGADHTLLRYVPPRLKGPSMHHSDHVIMPMIDFARQFLGAQWRPQTVDVNYGSDRTADLLQEHLGVPIRFDRPGVGIQLSQRELAQRRTTPFGESRRLVTLRELAADTVLANAPEPARAISAIVALRLLDGRTDIDGAARLAGLSVQGLQRRLRHIGYTYREIVEVARHARAASLLRETTLPVVDIALSLGYEEHPSFTRAFKRWTQLPPSEYRKVTVGDPRTRAIARRSTEE